MKLSLSSIEPKGWDDCMLDGDFPAAWALSDRVLAERAGQSCSHWPRHLQYIWDGRPIDGRRVLVRCYHGLGDTTQFIRYIPLLCERAREVVVWAQPELLPLLRTVDARAEFIALHDGVPPTHYDVDLELMELPYLFRSTLEDLPATVPYLHAPATKRLAPSEPFQVGLVWTSGDWNPARSLRLAELQPLFNQSRVVFHALQQGDALADWHLRWGPISGDRNPDRLAKIMLSLDLVISVDSFPAHLAGALGVPVWLLLARPNDWRWLRSGDRSPWYPTMRIFRQSAPNQWEPVINEVKLALERQVSAKTPKQPPG